MRCDTPLFMVCNNPINYALIARKIRCSKYHFLPWLYWIHASKKEKFSCSDNFSLNTIFLLKRRWLKSLVSKMVSIWTEISFDIVTLYGPDFQLNNHFLICKWKFGKKRNDACFYDPVHFEGLESLSDQNVLVTVG